MITYAVMDIGAVKKQYYGSSVGTSRPFEHLRRSSNVHLGRAAKARPGDFYVVVGCDDGLETREEEQYLLDFYFGSEWCLNHSPTASGNPQAIINYNNKVSSGELPHSWAGKGKINTWMPEENKRRIQGGTHNFLKENTKEDLEKLRISRVREAITGDNNPMKSPENVQKISESLKGRDWWVNEEGKIKFSFQSPGPEWVKGRKWKKP